MRKLLAALFSLFASAAPAAFALGPQTESWSSFIRPHAEGGASTVLVDLDLLRWLAQSPHGAEVTITVDILEANEHGLPNQAELAFLYSVEDRLTAEIRQSGQGRLIGHIFGQGKAVFHIYAETEGEALLPKLLKVAQALRPATSAQIVPVNTTQVVQHVLLPTAAEDQVAKDAMVLAQLAQNGDIATALRDIEHWAYFPDQLHAEQFADAIRADGMTLISVAVSADASGRFQVYFSHNGSVLPEDISGVTVRLDELARQSGGQYDGWATPVIRQE